MHLATSNRKSALILPALPHPKTFHEADYLACMCHEIGTPLTAILGLSHIIANVECGAEKKKECVVMLNESSAMLMGLMKNMLDASRLEAGMVGIENITFDLAGLVQKAVTMMAPKAHAKGLKLHVKIGQMPTMMRGDPLRIQQIMLNLLGNAIKFTARGEVQLEVQAWPDTLGGYRARIAVTDTGIGIEQQHIMRIFDKYAQGHVNTSRHYGGTGLGLSISRALAKMMKGDIHVKSTLGKGSCFIALLSLNSANILKKTALS